MSLICLIYILIHFLAMWSQWSDHVLVVWKHRHDCYGFPVCCMLCVTIYGLLMRTHEASLNSLLLTEPPCCLGCVVLK